MRGAREIAAIRPRGVNQDIDPTELSPDFWSEATNFRFEDGEGKRALGSLPAFDDALIVEPRHLVRCSDPNGWLVLCENAAIFRDDLGVFHDVTHASWQDVNELPDNFTATELNEFTVINHAVDVPYYKPKTAAGLLTTLTGYSAGSCASMRAFKEHLFALGVVGVSSNHVKWSDSGGAGLPTVWTPGAGNEAGDAELSDTGGIIIDGEQLNDSLIIYKESSCYVCNYVGGGPIFTFRPLFLNLGLFARNCALAHRGRHLVLTGDDLVLHDGVRPESVIDAINRRWLFNQIDTTNYANTFLFLNRARNEAWICFPESGRQYPSLALTWSFEDGSFGVRELYTDQASAGTKGACVHISLGSTEVAAMDAWNDDADQWNEDATIWNQDIFTQYDEQLIAAQPASDEVISLDSAQTRFDGSNVVGRLARTGLDLGDASVNKLVQRLVPQISAPDGLELTCRVGAQQTRDQAVSWGPEQTFTAGQDETLSVYQFGRYIAVEFSSSDVDAWQMSGFDLDFKRKGFF